MTEHTNNTWEQLKGELNAHFAEVNDDQHHAVTMLHKGQWHKTETVQVYAERLYALAQDAFEKTDKALIESQLIGFFIDGFYYDFLHMKEMREGPKTFQQAVQSALAEQNLRKRFDLRSNIKHDQEEPMEIDLIWPRKKCFKCGKYGHIAKHCKSVNVIERSAEQSQNQGEVHC